MFGLDQTLPIAAGSDWLAEWGWAVLLFLGLLVVSLYLWSYLSKTLEKMQVRESDFIDRDVATFMSRMVKVVLIIILVFVGLYALAQAWPDFRTQVWEPYLSVIVDIIFVSMVLLVAMLIVRILRRISRRARSLPQKAKGGGSAVEVTSLLLCYVVYIIAAVIIILLLLSFIPNFEPIQEIAKFLDENKTKIGITIVVIVGILAIARLVKAIFEDYKFRTKKFNPQIVDLASEISRYALYLIAFMVAVFMLFSLAGMELLGVLLIIMILMFIFLGGVLSYSTIRNIISGLAIMDTDIFEVGERIRLNNGLVAEVVQKNLVFTRLRTEDGEMVEVPNSEILGGSILNYSRSGSHGVGVRLEVPTSIPHSVVEEAILRAVEREDGLLREPKPEVLALEFHDDKIVYEVVVYVQDALKAKKVKSDLVVKIQDMLLSAGLPGLASK
ncbi:MAG: mechanosensitive ion channel family protein [Methanomassiliicoccales archaeon]|nr:mechanosensitive ion channel family protein [Methanomassiliicoccales archaeon]